MVPGRLRASICSVNYILWLFLPGVSGILAPSVCRFYGLSYAGDGCGVGADCLWLCVGGSDSELGVAEGCYGSVWYCVGVGGFAVGGLELVGD